MKMKPLMFLTIYSGLAGSTLAQSITQLNRSATSSSPAPTAPTVLTPCGNEPPSCYLYQALDGILIYAYANYTYTQTVANLTYQVTEYRDTTITNTITALPTTTEELGNAETLCASIPGGCGDDYHSVNYNYQTTTVYSGTTLTSGHVYMQVGLLSIRNTGYKSVNDGGQTICMTDESTIYSQATALPPFSSLIDFGSTFNIESVQFPDVLVSELRNDPVYTNQYPEILTCSIGGGNGAPIYQVLVTQLTATTTQVQSLDVNYNNAAPATSVPALAAVTSVPPPPPLSSAGSSPAANMPPPPVNNPAGNIPPSPMPSQPAGIPSQPLNSPAATAPKPAQPVNSPNNSPGVVFVPTTVIYPDATPILSSVPVLLSPTTNINAVGSPIIASVPVESGTTTLIYVPITTVDAAGNPTTTSSAMTAIIVSGNTYLAPSSPPSNPTAAPGSPGGPPSVITFGGTGIPNVITIGSIVVTADSSSDFVISGQTLKPGGAITVASSVISLATGTATGTGRAAGSVIISVFGGPTAMASGTGTSGTGTTGSRPSIAVANQGARKRVDVVAMIKFVVVGVVAMIGQ